MSCNDLERAVFHPRPSPRTPRNGHSSLPAVSLSHEHILEALQRSPDNGATLDLAHKHLADVSETAAEELFTLGKNKPPESKSVPLARIALGHNRLSTLPVAFSLLSRLRYLNLKSNNFSLFPDVLTMMPALEVLDMSRNKIKRFPPLAGSLANIRVLSLSKNKINKLPAYFAEFRKLQIFKVDQNAVEWPPKYIMEPKGDLDDLQLMGDWIKVVQTWIRDNLQPSRTSSDDSTSSESKLMTPLQNMRSMSYLLDEDQLLSIGSPAHSRSISLESDTSTYSAIEASLRFSDVTTLGSKIPRSERPPRLNLHPFSGYNSGISPSSSPISYLPTPDDSVSSAEEEATLVQSPSQSSGQQHVRNASYAGADPQRPTLSSKKSLPDLRTTKSSLLRDDEPSGSALQFRYFPPGEKLHDSHAPIRRGKGSYERSSSRAGTDSNPSPTSPSVIDRAAPVPSIDVERNSYFRRFSTLPPSTISKAIPHSLLILVDAIRGILFAVSQVYQTLQHYTVYSIDERLSAVLLKVLDPASNYMIQLINALDRFDATSRRTLPSPTVCRAVVESCRDTVSVFGKAMGVLALQLKVLSTRDDVRYTRQMLLVLYGATAEISNAWQTIKPHMVEVEPLLRERPPPASIKHQYTPSTSLRSQLTAPSTPLPLNIPPRPLWRSHSAQPPAENDRTRMMRRHAGSFSSKDVQIGKMLPSYIDPPHSGGSVLPSPANAQTPRLATRQPNTVPSAVSSFRRSWGSHSRQGSQSSLLASSSTSSDSSSPSVPSRVPAQEVPLSSSTFLDNDAIDAMQVAVGVAPTVWELMDTVVGDIQDLKVDLYEKLTRAKALTRQLSDNIRAVKDSDPSANRKALRDDATVFAKTVISLCNVFKTHGATNSLPPALRVNMITLTNATEESVMLLHVSSFSTSTRPYSPMVGFTNSANVYEGRLGSSLSRSRSALHHSSARLASPALNDQPRTALPGQSFKIPPLPRMKSKDGGEDSN